MAALRRLLNGNPKPFSLIPRTLSISHRGIASKLFVGGLSFYTTEKGLLDAFSQYGQVMEAKIVMDRVSDKSKGFGFVTYASEDEAGKAIDEMNGKASNNGVFLVKEATKAIINHLGLPYTFFHTLPITEQSSSTFVGAADAMNDMNSNYNYGDKMVFQQTDAQIGNPMVPSDGNMVSSYLPNSSVSRPTGSSFDEKMLKALSLFKESSGGGILAQVWVPIKHGDHFMLTTSEQPYLLDQMLSGYREVSRTYSFSPELKPGSSPGLPDRVFISKVHE